jgi:hypothetical protein
MKKNKCSTLLLSTNNVFDYHKEVKAAAYKWLYEGTDFTYFDTFVEFVNYVCEDMQEEDAIVGEVDDNMTGAARLFGNFELLAEACYNLDLNWRDIREGEGYMSRMVAQYAYDGIMDGIIADVVNSGVARTFWNSTEDLNEENKYE